MAQVIPYRQTERLAPVASQKQRAPQVGFGQDVGRSVERAGAVGTRYAAEWEARNARQDEASVMELDAAFGERAREIQNGYLATQGKNALTAYEDTEKAWETAQGEFMSKAQGGRQQAMLGRVLAARREGFANRASAHRNTQGEVYHDGAELGRIASLGQDAASLPVNDPDRLVTLAAIDGAVRARGQRKGWDAEQTATAILEQRSGIHTATIAALIEQDNPEAADAYLAANLDQIEGAKITGLRQKVREAGDDKFVSMALRNEPPDLNEATETTVTVAGQSETLKVAEPVAGRVGSRFGPRRSPGGVGSTNHRGVDYPVPVGTPVTAALPGVVRWKDDPDGYGRYAVVDHGNGQESRYAHLGRPMVAEGTVVRQGDVIAMSGGAKGAEGAGNSQGAHLHFEFRRGGVAVNPEAVVGIEATTGTVTTGAGMPTTRADVEEWAERLSNGNRRRYDLLVQRGYAHVGQQRATRAEAEGEAERELQAYLPGGTSPVSDISQVPVALRSRLDPATLRGASRAFEADREGVDAVSAAGTFNDLMDIAITSPETFVSLGDMTQYQGLVTPGQMNTLRGQRRTILKSGPENLVNSLASGVSEVITAHMADLKIKDPVELATEKARLTQWVLDAANAMETPPDRNGLLGLVRLGVRQVESGGETRRAYEGGGSEVIPSGVFGRGERGRVVSALRREFPGRETFTDAQVEAKYRSMVYRGEL